MERFAAKPKAHQALAESASQPPALLLTPIVDTISTCCAARVGRAPIDVARAFLSGRRPPGCNCAARTLGERRVSRARPASRSNDARSRRRSRSSTIAPTSRRMSGADGVHVGQDDLTPADARADRRRRRRSRAVDARRAVRPRRSRAGLLSSRSGRCSRIEHEGDRLRRRRALTQWCGPPRCGASTRGLADGRDRRHHARQRRLRVIEAGAASVAVISDLLKGDPRRACRASSARLGESPI